MSEHTQSKDTFGDQEQAETTPVQYYSRSELPQREVALHRFSFKRKSTIIALSLLMALVLLIATAASATSGLNRLENQLDRSAVRAQDTISNARTLTLVLAAGAFIAFSLTVFLIVRIGPRIVALEFWIRRMGAGDLAYSVAPSGSDEITELMYDMEVLRRQVVRAQRLDLVQQLSDDLQEKNTELESVLTELHTTQDQMISRQKLAELGELTAGVAHEIRNPLNLVQNFARTSDSMMTELKEVIDELEGPPDEDQAEEIEELMQELTENMLRIQQHSDRANRIIQDMLAMGRSATGQYQAVQLNNLVEDHAMLAYHSARSHNPEFNMRILREYDPDAGEVQVISEDIGRVILNLVGNACYATAERGKDDTDYQPTMWLTTIRYGNEIEFRVRDNGNGIPGDVLSKIFNPFFTTKPTDQGTGLGLSLSNDIVQAHGGSILPDTILGEYAQFSVRIPVSPRVKENGT